jgi:hypothetical protein
MTSTHESDQKQTWTEQIQAAGDELWNRTEDLIHEGNVRRLIVRNEHGDILMRVPLNPAVVIVGVLMLVNPVLIVLGAIVALLAHLKVEIVREYAGTEH